MDDPLALDPETMRATGYRMVDLLVERVAGVRDEPALTRASPAEMRARLHGPAPEGPTDFEAMLATLERDVLAWRGRVDHPAYFAFIPGSSTWPGRSATSSPARSTSTPAVGWRPRARASSSCRCSTGSRRGSATRRARPGSC